ncbi:MAG: 2,3,4,5-tetrahydropyridine-2,6-dicarboxylate N-acetyltransferase [Candidatus Cloacimonas sp. 4484_209]|nr:MAG: 2,3,4,5-tetrahydropyridine-2,6-dicarboxylate N-acetyltransferase [Candidatus Cloacimonas sp. 4484_209]
MNYKEIAQLISKSKKKTPAKLFLKGEFSDKDFYRCGFDYFGEGKFWILIGDYLPINVWFKKHKKEVKLFHWEISARNSALPLADLTKFDARIEPGAIVRTGVKIGKGCVIMMGAVINIGAVIGERTMVDMNVVVGARARIGKRCHIGAGSVIAGVLEPPSKKGVSIGDNVLVGANAVVLEGVHIGKGSVVAAGAVVIKNVPPGVVVAGVPARTIKKVRDIKDRSKTKILEELRG